MKISILALAITTPSLAAAEGTSEYGESSTTAVSGYPTAGNTYGDKPELSCWSDDRSNHPLPLLLGIDVAEWEDQPKHVRATCGHLNGGIAASVQPWLFGADPGGQIRQARVAVGTVITGVRICVNNAPESKNKRLKGLKLYGRTFASNKLGDDETIVAEWKLPNCSDWKNDVHCPSGSVAVSAVVHRGDKGYNGVALNCRKVKKVVADPPKGPVSPKSDGKK